MIYIVNPERFLVKWSFGIVQHRLHGILGSSLSFSNLKHIYVPYIFWLAKWVIFMLEGLPCGPKAHMSAGLLSIKIAWYTLLAYNYKIRLLGELVSDKFKLINDCFENVLHKANWMRSLLAIECCGLISFPMTRINS